MTSADLRSAIERVLGTVPYTPPVSVKYCECVRDALRKEAPGVELDVYHRHTDLVVEASLGVARHKLVVRVA